MGLWNAFCGLFSTDSGSADIGCGSSSTLNSGCDINPATGLPMIDDCGGMDVGGSPYGMDIHHDDSWSTTSIGMSDDSWTTSSSSLDDSFSSGIGNSWDD